MWLHENAELCLLGYPQTWTLSEDGIYAGKPAAECPKPLTDSKKMSTPRYDNSSSVSYAIPLGVVEHKPWLAAAAVKNQPAAAQAPQDKSAARQRPGNSELERALIPHITKAVLESSQDEAPPPFPGQFMVRAASSRKGPVGEIGYCLQVRQSRVSYMQDEVVLRHADGSISIQRLSDSGLMSFQPFPGLIGLFSLTPEAEDWNQELDPDGKGPCRGFLIPPPAPCDIDDPEQLGHSLAELGWPWPGDSASRKLKAVRHLQARFRTFFKERGFEIGHTGAARMQAVCPGYLAELSIDLTGPAPPGGIVSFEVSTQHQTRTAWKSQVGAYAENVRLERTGREVFDEQQICSLESDWGEFLKFMLQTRYKITIGTPDGGDPFKTNLKELTSSLNQDKRRALAEDYTPAEKLAVETMDPAWGAAVFRVYAATLIRFLEQDELAAAADRLSLRARNSLARAFGDRSTAALSELYKADKAGFSRTVGGTKNAGVKTAAEVVAWMERHSR